MFDLHDMVANVTEDHPRWGFDEADEQDLQAVTAGGESAAPDDDREDVFSASDPQGLVTIGISPEGEVHSVRLANDWRASVGPLELQGSVAEAMNAATAHAIAVRAERMDLDDSNGNLPIPGADPVDEETPLTRDHVIRLIGQATSDATQFMQKASEALGQYFSAESDGRHVTVSGVRRHPTNVSIDARWASQVRQSEIESELTDALSKFVAQSSPGSFSQGAQTPAIRELMSLAANPQSTIRRISQRHES